MLAKRHSVELAYRYAPRIVFLGQALSRRVRRQRLLCIWEGRSSSANVNLMSGSEEAQEPHTCLSEGAPARAFTFASTARPGSPPTAPQPTHLVPCPMSPSARISFPLRNPGNGPKSSDGPARHRLPIGIQTFREIRDGGYYYVDKTQYLRRLAEGGKHYLLSRPRRFGKSLFLDTCKELFEGNRSLFQDLDIDDGWDWSVRHPVLRLSFGGGNFTECGSLHANIMAQLDGVERRAGSTSKYPTAPERLTALIEALHRKAAQPVAVLIDEYDKPIVDALDYPDTARTNRDLLRDVYRMVENADAHVRFSLFTGVSRFSKVSLFPGLDDLIDITLEPEYSAVCGYTERDLDTVFANELAGLDRDMIRDWYKGYSWLGEEVYNPLDILMLFRRRRFGSYWFETGDPKLLVDTLVRHRVSSVELGEMMANHDLLFAFDVDEIAPEALLFQTGYLTIKGDDDLGGTPTYRLGFPNREVRQSLNESLLRHLVKDATRQTANSVRLHELLGNRDFAAMRTLFQAFFSGIPNEWYTNSNVANEAGYHASVFYSYFAALGLDIVVEDGASQGRLDMAVRFGGDVYLFEFRVVEIEPGGGAMAQLNARRYADKYQGAGVRLILLGIEFSKVARTVVGFEVAEA